MRRRRTQIATLARDRQFLAVGDLSGLFNVSPVTIRGDLDALARGGHLRRVRGGAVARGGSAERPLEETIGAYAEAKRQIARAAAALVESGMSLILDVGSTATALADALVLREDMRDVTVFTNGLNIALILERADPRIGVVVTGGTLRPLQHSLVNPLGGRIFTGLMADLLFLGCNGVHPKAGLTNVNLPESEIKRQMLQAARRVVAVADGSKLGNVALERLCGVDEIEMLLTGGDVDQEVVAALRDAGLDVVVADG